MLPLPRPHSGIHPAPPLWLLVLVTFSGTLAMHMFVPALPSAAQDLHASAASIQMTISLYILGLGFGQLIHGPLSDCFGRRPTLMIGLFVYTVAGLVAALAPDVEILIGSRLAQALGGCAGLLMGRAIVRDTAPPGEAMGRLALMNLMTMIGPGLAPSVGSMITVNMGWRAVFYLLFGLGLLNMLCAWRLLPETGQPSGKLSLVSMGSDYRRLLAAPGFAGLALGGACATTSFYAFIAAAPFTFTHQFHRPLHEVGLYLGLLIVGISLGNAFASRASRRIAIERLLIAANGVSVLCALALLATVVLTQPSAPLTGALMFIYSVGIGVSSPAVLTKIISIDPRITGSAAGLYGFAQMAFGALCTSLASVGRDPTLAAATVLVVAGILGQIAIGMALRAQKCPG